jgi:hypothetical protein
MKPYTEAAAELRLLVQRTEERLASAAREPARLAPDSAHHQAEDLRTEAIGELFDTLDRIDCGLGTRLMLAMYPHCDAQAAWG